ncbi:UvrD-helicase domain-containing protein [Telluribacter humicola]|uniref:UvrD-helicase domain-containing protein n=1 Tax=Telluribacter humicola TaxID=1720261 RepID=UPI001A95F761|nr:UvrD-helicase domain-containing protein [Telluribacter humicola]
MFKIYSSSAGSGKTYTLTKEYIKLALHSNSDTYFRQILAVTFTNAAANEMKDRILSMLRLFGTEEGKRHPMMRDIVTELYGEAIQGGEGTFEEGCELIGLRAQRVFVKLLHRYSDFSVMTIDKFTQRLVSSFTDELGIPFGFETEVDSDLLASAVDRLLARIGQEGEDTLTRIVETYYRESAEDGKSWGSLPAQIREAAGDLLSEKSYLAMLKVQDLTMEDWVAIRNQLKESLNTIIKDSYCKVIAREAIALIQQNGLDSGDFAGGKNGLIGHFNKFKPEDEEPVEWWKLEATATVVKNLDEQKWYGSKASKTTQARIDELSHKLKELYECIQAHQVKHRERYFLFKQLEKHLYNLSLLGEIRKEFDSLLRQNNQVHISEFNRRVLEIVAREPVPFIFERLGEKYNHILVDEFQDTSKLQFANLLPLIDNALASGYMNLVVGDAKQSIYRFRGGDMDLILHLSQNQAMELASLLGDNPFAHERLLGIDRFLHKSSLRENRRSYREVTEFNNWFFGYLSKTLGQSERMVSAVFDEEFQQKILPEVKSGGHVQVEFVTMKDEDDATTEGGQELDAMVARTLQLIEELREQGYHWRDIAILCRKKKEAANLASALKERGFPLISEDSLSLAFARPVNLLVAFMQVLHTPDNRLARYEAAYLFHRVIAREVPSATQHELIRSMCGEKGLASFLAYFGQEGVELNAFRLRQLSVYELCEQLITAFRLFDTKTDSEYLFRFLDVVLEFGTRRSNHLADFLNYWEGAKNKLSITIPANADALRITTIHRSKGLEYPVVIIPYTNWSYRSNPFLDRLWVDLDRLDHQELCLMPSGEGEEQLPKRLLSSVVSVVSDLAKTPLAEQYKEEGTRTLLENLNLLYVAFTRPVQRMYILAQYDTNWDKGKTSDRVSSWLYNYLNRPDAQPGWQEGQSVYVLSEGAGECRHAHGSQSAIPHRLSHIISTDRTKSLRLRRLADRIFDTETFEKKNDWLQKLKHALSYLQTPDELPAVLRKLTTEGIIESVDAEYLRRSLQEVLDMDQLRECFDREATVLMRRELLLPGGRMLCADRAVTLPDGTCVLANFVAGAGNTDARRQMRKLVQAYQDMGQTQVKGVVVTLENKEVEWV